MIIEVLKSQIPFVCSLTLCVLANTLIGAIKHEKLDDFDWNKLLVGTIRYLVVILVICMLIVSLNIYEPLAIKFSEEVYALQQLINIGAFAKVLVQIKEYFDIKKVDMNYDVYRSPDDVE